MKQITVFFKASEETTFSIIHRVKEYGFTEKMLWITIESGDKIYINLDCIRDISVREEEIYK